MKKPFSEVAIARCDVDKNSVGAGIAAAALKNVLREQVDSIGGMSRYIKNTHTVFIKPNLTAGMPTETGGTTDVLFTEAVVELVKEAGAARVVVGECSGNESRSIESLTNLGYKAMCERQGVEMLDLDFAEFDEATVQNPKYKDRINLPREFLRSDVYISVPVLKTHISAGVTVAIKNGFGLLSDRAKMDAHRDMAIEKVVADIMSVKPADLVFVDGRVGSEGIAGGSDFEHPIRANLVVVGNDPVAVDAVSARLMRQNTRIRHIQWAAEQGAGNDRMDFILIRGASIEEAAVQYMSPADQIRKGARGKLKISELGACSLCCSAAVSMLGRYAKNPASLLAPVEVVTGPGEWEGFELKGANREDSVNDAENRGISGCDEENRGISGYDGETREDSARCGTRAILLGDCIKEKYRSAAKWVGGCPVDMREYAGALADFNIVCVKCENNVKKVVESLEQSFAERGSGDQNADIAGALPKIRILASNKSVYQGADNSAGVDDYLLAVGNCLSGYIRNHSRRAHKYSNVDVAEFAAHIEGCPVGENEIIDGLRDLLEKMRRNLKNNSCL